MKEEEEKDLLEVLKDVKSLTLFDYNPIISVSSGTIDALHSLTDLRSLSLGIQGYTGFIADLFCGLTQLTELNVWIWDDFGIALCTLTGLKTLRVHIKDNGSLEIPMTLSNMPNLELLSIFDGKRPMRIPSTAFAKLFRLGSIDLRYVLLDEHFFQTLAALPKLTEVTLIDNFRSHASVSGCIKLLKTVETLTLSEFEWKYMAKVAMKGCLEGCLPKLRYLNVDTDSINVSNAHLLDEIKRKLPGLRKVRDI